MGEATYYMKAHFSSTKKLDAAVPGITDFLVQGAKAQDWWQDNRGTKDDKKFWKEFNKKFPLVREYLDSFGFDGDCHNGLAGKIDFVAPEQAQTCEADGKVFKYAATVWHFAEWQPFADFIRTKFGAKEVNWLSDEYTDPFESL